MDNQAILERAVRNLDCVGYAAKISGDTLTVEVDGGADNAFEPLKLDFAAEPDALLGIEIDGALYDRIEADGKAKFRDRYRVEAEELKTLFDHDTAEAFLDDLIEDANGLADMLTYLPDAMAMAVKAAKYDAGDEQKGGDNGTFGSEQIREFVHNLQALRERFHLLPPNQQHDTAITMAWLGNEMMKWTEVFF